MESVDSVYVVHTSSSPRQKLYWTFFLVMKATMTFDNCEDNVRQYCVNKAVLRKTNPLQWW